MSVSNQKNQRVKKVREAVLTESPTGIAYGISDAIQSCLSSGPVDLVLMVCLMGPKSFPEGLKEPIAIP